MVIWTRLWSGTWGEPEDLRAGGRLQSTWGLEVWGGKDKLSKNSGLNPVFLTDSEPRKSVELKVRVPSLHTSVPTSTPALLSGEPRPSHQETF